MKILLFMFMIFSLNFAMAKDSKETMCKPTAQILHDGKTEPEFFNKTNNLTKKTGSIEKTTGEIILLKSILKDENCVPVYDAKIELWQSNQHGKFQFKKLTDINKNKSIEKKHIDKNFLGNGVDFTDNLGEFSFLTIMPGKIKNHSPHLNLRIKHAEFKEFETKIYFDNNNNTNDIDLRKIKNKKSVIANFIGMQKGHRVYQIKINLNGVNQHKTY